MIRGFLSGMLLLLGACTTESAQEAVKQPAKGGVEDTVVAHILPDAASAHFDGVLVVGGRFTLGDTVGQDLASIIGQGIQLRNASITGEALPALLERLPYLLEQQPAKLVLELGMEDELARTQPVVFKRELLRLGRLLGDTPSALLCTAQQPAYRNTLQDFAESAGIPIAVINPKEGRGEKNVRILRTVLAD